MGIGFRRWAAAAAMVVISLAGCGKDPEPSVDVRTMTDPCAFLTAKELDTLRLNDGHLLDTDGDGTQPTASAATVSSTCVFFSRISNSAEYYLSNVQVTVADDDLATFIAVLERTEGLRFTRVSEGGYYRSVPRAGADDVCNLVFVANASTVVHLQIGVLPHKSGQFSKRPCEVVSDLAPFIQRRIPPQPET
jgi:hypothetical protein